MEFLESTLFLVLVMAILTSVVSWSLYNGISPMPTSLKAKKGISLLLPQEVKGVIYDLGSGWGTLLILMAKKYPDCQLIGLETSFIPFWFSRVRLHLMKLPHVKLMKRDFYSVNLNQASLVVCYLYPDAMKKLQIKFEEELKSGTFIISNTFALPKWKPETVAEIGDLYHTKIYLYRV